MDEAAKTSGAEAWRERITAKQTGGQSIRALCKENGWHEHAFYWWRSRLGLSPASAIRRGRRPKMSAGFAEVVVDRSAITSPAASIVEPPAASIVEPPAASIVEPIYLRLGGGRELVLPMSMADERVASLIRLIEASR